MTILAPGGVDGKRLVACDPVLHKLNYPTHGPLRASTKNAIVFPKTRLLAGWFSPSHPCGHQHSLPL